VAPPALDVVRNAIAESIENDFHPAPEIAEVLAVVARVSIDRILRDE